MLFSTLATVSTHEFAPAAMHARSHRTGESLTKGHAMAKGLNKVLLLGNVGRDPEIKATASGMMVAQFSLATADRAKDVQGNWADKTEWHTVVCFQRTADVVRDYVMKGSQVLVEGKIQTRTWDDKSSGEKKYKTEIVCNELTLLSGKAGTGSTHATDTDGDTEDLGADSIPF